MIIAIGGGEIVDNEIYEVDKFIVESAKKENPNFLFIPTASKEVNKKIENADIIYVGGGNTAYMMELWQVYAVDKALMRAYKSGKILSGLSAGSICWFIAGHSDSEFVEGKENPKSKWVKGLGIVPYLHCPHYDEPERANFDDFYSGQIADAIAIENQVAIVWDDYEMKVIKSNPLKNAYYLSWSDKGLNKKVLL